MLIETQALVYVLTLKKLMPHEARKSTKIMAVACGWALSELVSTKILQPVAAVAYEDVVRPDVLITSLSAVLDFVRIVGTTFLAEKLTRKGVCSEAKTFIYFALVLVAFLSEMCIFRIEKNKEDLDALNSRSLLAERDEDYY